VWTVTDQSRREILVATLAGISAPTLLAQTASAQSSSIDADCDWLGAQNAQGYALAELGATTWSVLDVRSVPSPTVSETRYHDGSGTGNPEGPAFYRSSNSGEWVSLVDGSVIS